MTHQQPKGNQMSDAKHGVTHTPGPWHVGEGSKTPIVYDSHGWAVANAMTYHNQHDSMDANARLIAAAPELMTALRPFANFACSPPGDCMCHNCRARDVIAKATGATHD